MAGKQNITKAGAQTIRKQQQQRLAEMKRTVEIIRTASGDKQTLGVMRVLEPDGWPVFTLKCLELPWRDNKRKISRIPEGVYKLAKVAGTALIPYPHLWIYPVPNRSGIKIHKGNYYYQLEGCVLPGLTHTDLNKDGLLDVTDSEKALKKLMDALPDETTITIS